MHYHVCRKQPNRPTEQTVINRSRDRPERLGPDSWFPFPRRLRSSECRGICWHPWIVPTGRRLIGWITCLVWTARWLLSKRLRNFMLHAKTWRLEAINTHRRVCERTHPPHLAQLAQATHSHRKWIRAPAGPMRTSPLRISLIWISTDLMEIVAAASTRTKRSERVSQLLQKRSQIA